MKKVLVIASDRSELRLFRDDYYTAVSGVGIALASGWAALEGERIKADVLVSVGSAGSLGEFKRGDVISFSSVVTPDQNLTSMHLALGTTIDWTRATFNELYTADRKSPYRLLSSSSFSSEKDERIRVMKADATDMEAYGVGLAAKMLSIPFFAVKVITDIVGDKSTVGDISASLRESRARLLETVRALLAEV